MERGRDDRGPSFNYKKMCITRGRWEKELAEDRCTSAKAKAAGKWLYKNNMTYRQFYKMHKSILVSYKKGTRSTLYEKTSNLLISEQLYGLEVAAWPLLYPWARYGDTDIRSRLVDGGSGTAAQHYSGKQSYIRKLLSRCKAYEQEFHLIFYLHDAFFARMLTTKMNVADRQGVTVDITADSSIQSESYWRHEQDITADIVRQMSLLCRRSVPGDEIHAYQNSLMFQGHDTPLEFPNLFITISPAEWKHPKHCSAKAYYPHRGHDTACFSSIHMYELIRGTMLTILTEANSEWFTKVFHYVMRLEFQKRGTLHFHIAIWCIPKYLPTHYKGRSKSTPAERMRYGHQDTSPFHAYLTELFACRIDVQWTTGRLNYINGYVTKAQDSMDFRLDKETADGGTHNRWRSAYRLLCRKTVCVPEVALWFNESEPMIRSFRVWKCYAPIAWACDKKNNQSELLYQFYLDQDDLCRGSFLQYCRIYKIDKEQLKPFSKTHEKATISVGVRYASEMRVHFYWAVGINAHAAHPLRAALSRY